MQCQARRYQNDMICGLCRLQWSVKDKDVPSCNPRLNEPTLKRMASESSQPRSGSVIIDEAAVITDEQWEHLKESLRGEEDR